MVVPGRGHPTRPSCQGFPPPGSLLCRLLLAHGHAQLVVTSSSLVDIKAFTSFLQRFFFFPLVISSFLFIPYPPEKADIGASLKGHVELANITGNWVLCGSTETPGHPSWHSSRNFTSAAVPGCVCSPCITGGRQGQGCRGRMRGARTARGFAALLPSERCLCRFCTPGTQGGGAKPTSVCTIHCVPVSALNQIKLCEKKESCISIAAPVMLLQLEFLYSPTC